MLIFKILIFLPLLAILNMSCQHKEKHRVKSEETGKFYFHKIKASEEEKIKASELEIFIDGQKATDLEVLDKKGIEQREGKHKIDIKGKKINFGLSEIDYNIKRNQELHLYFCESDKSFHSYVFPSTNNFDDFQTGVTPFNEYTQALRARKRDKEICSLK